MNTRRIFSVILLLAGELLIIFCFLNFGKNLDSKIVTLDIIVSTIIYSLFFVDLLYPILDLKDKSQKVVGSLGLRWFFSTLYILSAISLMVIFIWKWPLDISSQYLIHGILFFLLILGLFFVINSSHKVEQIFIEETQDRSRLEELKKATREVQLKLDKMKDIREDINTRLSVLHENIRFLAPSNNRDAYELETDFLNEMKAVRDCLFSIPLNYDKILENIQNCERTYKERKQVYTK